MCTRTLIFLSIFLAAPCYASPQVTSLSEAITRTRTSNPLLQGQKHRIESSKGLMRQADLIPNPELELEIEEFGGDRDGFNETETTIAISQPLELGGKRDARVAVAKGHSEIVELETLVLDAKVISRVEITFAKIQQAQAVKNALDEQVNLSRKIVEVAKRKLNAGAILPVEKTKALISWQKNKAAVIEAENELLRAKLTLASMWKGSPADIGEVDKASLPTNISRYLTTSEISDSPYVRLQSANRELADKQLELERSLAIPNINVGVGYKRFEETNDNTFLGTLSIELPFFNRNQGSIEGAREQLNARKLSNENNLVEAKTRLTTLQNKLKQLLDQYQLLNKAILPSAKRAYREAEEAYRQGRSNYLELNDAQETLFESKIQKNKLLFTISESISTIRQITGEHVLKADQTASREIK